MMNPSAFAMVLFTLAALVMGALAYSQATGGYDPGFNPLPIAIGAAAVALVSMLFARRVR